MTNYINNMRKIKQQWHIGNLKVITIFTNKNHMSLKFKNYVNKN